jgi:hypothetical protein
MVYKLKINNVGGNGNNEEENGNMIDENEVTCPYLIISLFSLHFP